MKTTRPNRKICFGGRSLLSELALSAALGLAALLSADIPAACPPGNLDTSFNGTGKVTTPIGAPADFFSSVAIQSDGKIVVAGSNGSSNGDFAVVRYNSNGSLDNTFNGTGIVTTDIVNNSQDHGKSVAIQGDGKIIVAGWSETIDPRHFAVVRYNSNGSLDTSFNGTGKVTTTIGGSDEASSVAIQGDGKIVVAGQSYNGSDDDFAVVRYNSNGSLDTSFNGTGKVTTPIGSSSDYGFSVAIQSDGKIIVAGSSYSAASIDFAVVRYNSNGTLDTSFNGTGKVVTDFVGDDDTGLSVAIQSDGKIVVAGNAYDGSSQYPNFAVVRYNSNGILDTSFNGTGKVTTSFGSDEDDGRSVAIQGDGKIVLAGSTYNRSSNDDDFAVLRYNSNGALDESFNGTGKLTTDIASGSYDIGSSVALDGSGNILVAGTSENFFAVVRYVGSCAPPNLQLVSAASRKSHSGVGNFDVDLPIGGQLGVECRTGGAGGNHTLIFTFNNQIASGNANVTSGSGTVSGSPSFSGKAMTVNLTGVANAQTLTVTLSGVTDQFSQVLPDTPVSVKMLVGDTNGTGAVNASDVTQTKNRIGRAVTVFNFRSDVNVSGVINSTDVAIVKAHSG